MGCGMIDRQELTELAWELFLAHNMVEKDYVYSRRTARQRQGLNSR